MAEAAQLPVPPPMIGQQPAVNPRPKDGDTATWLHDEMVKVRAQLATGSKSWYDHMIPILDYWIAGVEETMPKPKATPQS